MGLLSSVYDWLFGCRHANLSRVFGIKGRNYKVCLDCGREFIFDWKRMRPMKTKRKQRLTESESRLQSA